MTTDNHITIRRLGESDSLADIIELSKAFFEEYENHDAEFFEIDELKDSHIRDYFNTTINNPDGVTFIACDDAKIVGYITAFLRPQPEFWTIKRIGAISGLMVDPNYRRRGIASRLVNETTTFFRENNITHYTVYTAASNTSALQLYEKAGMTHLYTTLLGRLDIS